MRFAQKAVDKTATTNYEDAPAFSLSPKLALYSAVCTASLEPKFYTSQGPEEIENLCENVPDEFIAKLAIYAREQMYLRSVPIVLAVTLAKQGSKFTATVAERIIQRADELVEIMSYYAQSNGRNDLKKLSKGLKLGVSRAFNKFDEYQFAKYNRDTEIKLRDVMFVTHPKPKPGQKRLFKKIADDTLEIPYTWETQLSKGGDKKKTWEELIKSKKLGYMALLRNLRNMLQADISDKAWDMALSYLMDPEAIKKSKQLPFRFFSAYKEISETAEFGSQKVLEALDAAMIASVENLKGFDSNTRALIACDTSGSMNTSLSERSKIQYVDIGLVLGMMLHFKCKKVLTGIFGEDWAVFNTPKDNILQNTDKFSGLVGEVGHATNGWKILAWAIEERKVFDKFFFFTDCQWWDSLGGHYGADAIVQEYWLQYKAEVNPDARAYYFDVAGYGDTPLRMTGGDVAFISGWSDKVFAVLDTIEQGGDALQLIDEIKL